MRYHIFSLSLIVLCMFVPVLTYARQSDVVAQEKMLQTMRDAMPKTIVIVMDDSGSMDNPLTAGAEKKIVIAARIAKAVTQTLKAGDQFDLINFDNSPAGEKRVEVRTGHEEEDRLAAANLITTTIPNPRGKGTNIRAAHDQALKIVENQHERRIFCLLITDGWADRVPNNTSYKEYYDNPASQTYKDYAARRNSAHQQHVELYGIGVDFIDGIPQEPNKNGMNTINHIPAPAVDVDPGNLAKEQEAAHLPEITRQQQDALKRLKAEEKKKELQKVVGGGALALVALLLLVRFLAPKKIQLSLIYTDASAEELRGEPRVKTVRLIGGDQAQGSIDLGGKSSSHVHHTLKLLGTEECVGRILVSRRGKVMLEPRSAQENVQIDVQSHAIGRKSAPLNSGTQINVHIYRDPEKRLGLETSFTLKLGKV